MPPKRTRKSSMARATTVGGSAHGAATASPTRAGPISFAARSAFPTVPSSGSLTDYGSTPPVNVGAPSSPRGSNAGVPTSARGPPTTTPATPMGAGIVPPALSGIGIDAGGGGGPPAASVGSTPSSSPRGGATASDDPFSNENSLNAFTFGTADPLSPGVDFDASGDADHVVTLGNDKDDEDGVHFDTDGCAEIVASVRVTKGRRIPLAVQVLARVKPLWKHRLLRIVTDSDGLGSHRSYLEIHRLKSPETGSRETNGLVERIFLRSLDSIQRATVAPDSALPFYVPLSDSSSPSSPTILRSAQRRTSLSFGAVTIPHLPKEFRYGGLMMRLAFVVGDNNALNNLYFDEEHLRKVARTQGALGLAKAAKMMQQKAVYAASTGKSFVSAIADKIAKLKEGDQGVVLGGANSTQNNKAEQQYDAEEDPIENIDICFRSAVSRDAWFEWFNDFILQHELHELREDVDLGVDLAETARQQSWAAIVASVSSPEDGRTVPDVLGNRNLSMMSAPGSANFGRDLSVTSGSFDLSGAKMEPLQLGAPSGDNFAIPERPSTGVAQFIHHFTSVDPSKGESQNGGDKKSTNENGIPNAPCGGMVSRLVKNGKYSSRRLMLGRRPGEVIVSGGLTTRRDVIDLTKSRVVVEKPWARNFIIISPGSVGGDMSTLNRAEVDHILQNHKKAFAVPEKKKKATAGKDGHETDGEGHHGPSVAAKTTQSVANAATFVVDASISLFSRFINKASVVELCAAKMDDRDSFVEWLLKVRGNPQSDNETHLYREAEQAALGASKSSMSRGMSEAIIGGDSQPQSDTFRGGGDDDAGGVSPTTGPSRQPSMVRGYSMTSLSAPQRRSPTRRNSGILSSAASDNSSGEKTKLPMPSGVMRPTTWNVDSVHRRSFLTASYAVGSGGSRRRRGGAPFRSSSDQSSSGTDDDDELPENMIARPVFDATESVGTLHAGQIKSPSGTATPVMARSPLDPLARLRTGAGDDTIPDPEVFDAEERGAWCYVAFQRDDFPPTAGSSFHLRYVYLQAAEPPSGDSFDLTTMKQVKHRRGSGRFVIFNSNDFVQRPCIESLGADIISISRWSSIAGRAGIHVRLNAGPNTGTVDVHIVASDHVTHERIFAYMQFRLRCAVWELQPGGEFGLTPTDVPSMTNVEHRVAVMAGVDRIMSRGAHPASRSSELTSHPSFSVVKSAVEAATSTLRRDPNLSTSLTDILARHFEAEAQKERELESTGPTPCPLCGVESKHSELTCRATGLFHAEAIRTRQQDAARGLLSSVFDTIPKATVEVPRPPPRGAPYADVAQYHGHLDRTASLCREAIEQAGDAVKRVAARAVS